MTAEQSDQKTAVVTGASSGIGRATAQQLAAAGWRVIAIARSEDKLAELAKEYPSIEPRPVDLTTFEFDGLVPDRVDALVHSAGQSHSAAIEETSTDEWTQLFALNVTAGAELVRLALPALRASEGTVVFVNSGAGVAPVPRSPVYAATKHALRALANGLRAELEEDRVRVTSVYPGPVETEMFTGDVDRSQLIQADTVARAIITAITASGDTQLTDIHVRPRAELTW